MGPSGREIDTICMHCIKDGWVEGQRMRENADMDEIDQKARGRADRAAVPSNGDVSSLAGF